MDPSRADKAALMKHIIHEFAKMTHKEQLDTYTQMINGPPPPMDQDQEEEYSREVIIKLVALKYPGILAKYHQTPKPGVVDGFVDVPVPGVRAVFQEFRNHGGRRRRRRSATAHKSSSSRHRRSSKKSGNKRKRQRRASRRSH